MTRAVIDDAGRTAGPASLCQGVYGARGNLELIVPDAADGLWVHWFNSDLPSDPAASADVPPGTWSGGLRFATGRAYAAAVILQSPLGPDHLEVLAVTRNRELESWYWSPGPGFQRRGTVVSGTDAIAAMIAEDGALDAAARVAGAWRRLVAGPEGYPERRWVDTGQTEAPPASRNAECVSTRNGGTLERVVREPDGVLVHLATRGARDIS